MPATCPRCGATTPADTEKCPSCGETLAPSDVSPADPWAKWRRPTTIFFGFVGGLLFLVGALMGGVVVSASLFRPNFPADRWREEVAMAIGGQLTGVLWVAAAYFTWRQNWRRGGLCVYAGIGVMIVEHFTVVWLRQ